MKLLLCAAVLTVAVTTLVATGPPKPRTLWSLHPVARPDIPKNEKRKTKNENPIDAFVGVELAKRGLKPNPRADKRTLVRRATFDLTGLPPTPEEVDAYLNDRSPNAWEKVIERLLASPHYGERWGRHWLDVARYSDTKGYVFFQDGNFPWAYTYRDYVVRSFNEDKPYDRFILEQLAADKLPLGEDKRVLAALGFISLGGRFMNNEHDIIDDRIDVVTRGLQGLTVSCARCHDHKYDPIPTRDYYALYGVFANTVEPEIPPLLEPPPRTEKYAAFERELQARMRKLTDFVRTKHAEMVNLSRTRAAEFMLAAHAERNKPRTDDFMLIADGTDLNPKMLLRWQVYLERTREKHHPVFALWNALAALPENEFAARAPTLVSQVLSDSAHPVNARIATAFRENPPKSLKEATDRYGSILNEAYAAKYPEPIDEALRQVFHGANSPPMAPLNLYGDLALLPDRPSQETLKKLRDEVDKWRSSSPDAPARAMAMVDAPEMIPTRVFVRGNPHTLGELAPRRFLTCLSSAKPPLFQNGSGRLELARAIANARNPLTARVMVNRIWMHHFGEGLVRTPSDLGFRGDPPSHPQLLDWLAAEFMNPGVQVFGYSGVQEERNQQHLNTRTPEHLKPWSIKHIHRLMMLSETYRQTSDERAERSRVDPENRLLWRMNRRRLDWESTRDSLAAVAGSLDRKIGGPPVELFGNPSSNRRTLYGKVDRLHVAGLYRTFDFANPDTSCPRRDETTVPQQALFWMNHPFTSETAKHLLERPEVSSAADSAARVRVIYPILFGRNPTNREQNLAYEFLGGSPTPVAWQRFTQALLQTNEFVFVD